ncbi:hypothetical protein MMC11_007468 [Xylographa trunciseda]|nr:hypothetical protein [Xylographa trunciseda]
MPNERRKSSILSLGLDKPSKPKVDITLNDQQEENLVPSYTTLDKIEGTASITAPVDINFDDIHITFQGVTRTYVEKVSSTHAVFDRSKAYHSFLRLSQPIRVADYPENHVLKAGETYTYPFTFVVPEKLLPQSCTHPRDNERVLDAHLELPPSFGDSMLGSDGKTLLEDLAPDMTIVSYSIRVLIIRRSREPAGKLSILIDAAKKLRIIPAVDELPPLPLSGTDSDDYTIRKEKDLKKGMFKGKLGRITVESSQPSSLRLPYCRLDICTARVTTMAVVNLRFDPSYNSAKPPRLGNLVNKLKVVTFFAAVPARDFPSRADSYIYETQRGVFVENVNLISRNVESVQWVQHNTLERHDSAISVSDNPSSPSASQIFYTAQILVPVDLPTNSKTFVPTFHSCLVSRVYYLSLTLSVHVSGATASPTSIHLKIPLQVSSEGNPDARPTISEEEMQAIAARNIDADLEPRSLAPPSPEYIEHAHLDRSGSVASAILPPSPEYIEHDPPTARAGSVDQIMPPIPEYSEHAEVMQDMMRPVRRSDLQVGADSTGELPGYSALGGRATGVRGHWDRRMSLQAMRA